MVCRHGDLLHKLKTDIVAGEILAPFTSTPFQRKDIAAKGRSAVGTKSIKVHVHDGLALR